MAVVVACIVDDFRMREADETNDEEAKQGGDAKLRDS